jgi:nitrogen fixation protein NifU and related proteins
MTGGLPYGSTITEHFRRPRNYGALPNATAAAEGVNPLCGDRVRLAVLVDDRAIITDARFTANACAICVASASLLTDHLRGMPRAEAAQLTEEAALGLVGNGIPAARRRCATLPLEALQRAIGVK